MQTCHNPQSLANFRALDAARERVQAFIDRRRAARAPVDDLEAVEREIHELVSELEREMVAEEVARFDVDVPAVVIDGVEHRRVLRCEQTYLSAAGPVRVERTLYANRGEVSRAVCPLELKAGIVEGFWTPRAARHGAWAVAHLTPQEAEELFGEPGVG